MSWLKDVVIDIAVTVVIVVFALTQAQWAWWVIVIYTPLMVVLKIVALNSRVAKGAARQRPAAPVWFYHVLYAVSVGALAFAGWWIMAAGWAAIWILSIVTEARSGAPRKA